MRENVIFCYSGTGNCLDMAKTIARELGDTDIILMRKEPAVTDVREARRVGFIFPCYGGGLPGGVEESLRKIQVGLTAYTFGVCQYAGYMGSGLYKLNSIIPLRYWTAVSHQCTCIWLLPHSVMLPPVTPAMAQRRADKKAKQIAQAVLSGAVSPKAPPKKPVNQLESSVWPKIVAGKAQGAFAARDYFARKKALMPQILEAFDSLAEENDVIVIEGAGSPAEINLAENDIVNMGLARAVSSPVLLAGDIDPGGVFAQLYGTVALLAPEDRALLRGLVVNKFRGDVEILRPGLAPLEKMCGVPVVGIVPYLTLDLDDEDSLAPRLSAREARGVIDVAVVRLPHLSNFTDFDPLSRVPGVGVRYVSSTTDLGRPDLVVLPGSKTTLDDARWLAASGIGACVRALSGAGTPVLGMSLSKATPGTIIKSISFFGTSMPSALGSNIPKGPGFKDSGPS